VEAGTIFSGLLSATAVARALKELLARTTGTRRALALELKKNLALVALYERGDAPIDRVIERLEVARYEQAAASNFDFNSFNRRKIAAEAVRAIPALHPYAGWSTEELFESIYLKIHALKNLSALNARAGEVRKEARLRNVARLMLLLLRHVQPAGRARPRGGA
jgi:hypothetical protein